MKRLLIIGILFCSILFSGGVFAQNQPSRASVERESNGFAIQINGNRVTIQNATPRASVFIYSILGVKLKEYKSPQNGDDFQFDLPKGCYILKSENIVRKVAIK